MNSHGKNVTVASVEVLHVPETKVFNFEVEVTHSYFAGGVWVHNYEKKNIFQEVLMTGEEKAEYEKLKKEAEDNMKKGLGDLTDSEVKDKIEKLKRQQAKPKEQLEYAKADIEKEFSSGKSASTKKISVF